MNNCLGRDMHGHKQLSFLPSTSFIHICSYTTNWLGADRYSLCFVLYTLYTIKYHLSRISVQDVIVMCSSMKADTAPKASSIVGTPNSIQVAQFRPVSCPYVLCREKIKLQIQTAVRWPMLEISIRSVSLIVTSLNWSRLGLVSLTTQVYIIDGKSEVNHKHTTVKGHLKILYMHNIVNKVKVSAR